MSSSIKQDFTTSSASTVKKTSPENKQENSTEASSQILGFISQQLSDIDLEDTSTNKQFELSDIDLEGVMMLIGQLTTVIQRLEAEFASVKGTANADIAQTMLDSAKESLKKVNDQIEANRKAREKQASSSWIDDLVTAVECVISVVLMCIPGCQGMGVAMMVMMILDKVGVTAKLAKELEKAGLPSAAAGIIASAIMGLACGGVCGVAGAAINGVKTTAEQVAVDAVRNTVKAELKEAIAKSVEEATKNCAEDQVASLAQNAARTTAKSIVTRLSQVWGSDIIGGEVKDAMKEGVKEGLKRAGKSLSRSVISKFFYENSLIENMASITAKETTEGVEYTAQFTKEGLTSARKLELEGMVTKFKEAVSNSNLKTAVRMGVAETLNSLNSTGVMNELAAYIVDQTYDGNENTKRKIKTGLSIAFEVLNMLAAAYVCMSSSNGPTQSVGAFGKIGSNVSKRLRDYPKTLALLNAVKNNPERVVRTLQLAQSGFQAGHGSIAIDTAIKLKETADIMAEYQPRVELYRNLSAMAGKQMDEDQKVFEKLQAATASMLEDAESIAQLMGKAAQEALN
jgi:hypothetical protein